MLRIEKPLYPEFIEGQTKRADAVIRPCIKNLPPVFFTVAFIIAVTGRIASG